MKDLVSLGDYLSDLGYSPSCHEKVVDNINNFNGSSYTIYSIVDSSDEELEELINQAIDMWNENEFSFQDLCGEEYGLSFSWFEGVGLFGDSFFLLKSSLLNNLWE